MKHAVLITFMLITFTSCRTSEKVALDTLPDETNQLLLKNSKKYLDIISSINSASAEKIQSNLVISAVTDGKKYNASGMGYYIREPLSAKITMNDNVFRFRVMDILIKDEKIRAYYPLEKTLVIDNFSSDADSLNKTTGQSSNVLASLFIGKIPLIEKYRVVKLHEFPDEGETFLDLENPNYTQTISFKNDIPYRIIVKSKISEQNFSIKYTGHYMQSDCHFFKIIEIASQNPYSYVKINYTKTFVDGNFKPENIFVQKVPSDISVIDLTR